MSLTPKSGGENKSSGIMINEFDRHKSNMRATKDWEIPTIIFFFYNSVHHSSHIFLQNDFCDILELCKNLHNELHQLDVSKTKGSLGFDIKWECSIRHSFYFSHSGLSKVLVPLWMCISRKIQETMSFILWHFSCWWRASEMGWIF